MGEEEGGVLRQSASPVVPRRGLPGRASIAFATGAALSGVLMTSSTAPALLDGGSPKALQTRAEGFGAHFPAPAGMVVDYSAFRDAPDRSADVSDGNDIPPAVRTPIPDDQLLGQAPALVAASEEPISQQPSGNPAPRKTSTPAKSPGASAFHGRKVASRQVTGCSRCAAPSAHSSPRRANLIASLFSGDLFRARFVRRANRPAGVAQQREAPRLTAWSFRRT